MVCRRSSVSTSFMLAALRVLHVDVSIAFGTGSLDRAKAICASEFAYVGSVVLSAYILGSWFLDLFRGRVERSSGGGGRLGYGRRLAWLVQRGLVEGPSPPLRSWCYGAAPVPGVGRSSARR